MRSPYLWYASVFLLLQQDIEQHPNGHTMKHVLMQSIRSAVTSSIKQRIQQIITCFFTLFVALMSHCVSSTKNLTIERYPFSAAYINGVQPPYCVPDKKFP